MIFFLALFITAALLVMLVNTVTNLVFFPRLHRHHASVSAGATRCSPPDTPLAILIPARNEAARIGPTIRALLAQDYPNFAIFVLDDHSTDQTLAVVQQAAQGDGRVRVLTGLALPTGWGGKNWACQQLAQAAEGFAAEAVSSTPARHELLIFTDADVIWQPGALTAVVECLTQTGADLLTVWPTQITVTWGERLVTPLMALAIWAYLPIWLVHRTPYPSAAAANGQCLVFRHQAYQRSGGHAAVANQIVEDVQLARRIKAAGGQLRMVDGAGLIQSRMYQKWPEVRNGFAKNILAGHGNSVGLLLLSTLFHCLVFMGPWLWFAAGGLNLQRMYWPLWPLGLILLGVGIRALSAYGTGQRIRDSWLLPLSASLMSIIAGQAIWWQLRYGGPAWKGRIYRPTA